MINACSVKVLQLQQILENSLVIENGSVPVGVAKVWQKVVVRGSGRGSVVVNDVNDRSRVASRTQDFVASKSVDHFGGIRRSIKKYLVTFLWNLLLKRSSRMCCCYSYVISGLIFKISLGSLFFCSALIYWSWKKEFSNDLWKEIV